MPVPTVTPGIVLMSGQQYVIFASITRVPGAPSAARWGALTNDTTYPGGRFVFINNGTDESQWTGTNWSFISEDLAMKVDILGLDDRRRR